MRDDLKVLVSEIKQTHIESHIDGPIDICQWDKCRLAAALEVADGKNHALEDSHDYAAAADQIHALRTERDEAREALRAFVVEVDLCEPRNAWPPALHKAFNRARDFIRHAYE